MRRSSSDGTNKKKNLYAGVCSKCGEIYEASTAVDDLEGLTFNCKKMLCSGRVQLCAKHKYKNEKSLAPVSSLEDAGLEELGPRRYC